MIWEPDPHTCTENVKTLNLNNSVQNVELERELLRFVENAHLIPGSYFVRSVELSAFCLETLRGEKLRTKLTDTRQSNMMKKDLHLGILCPADLLFPEFGGQEQNLKGECQESTYGQCSWQHSCMHLQIMDTGNIIWMFDGSGVKVTQSKSSDSNAKRVENWKKQNKRFGV